MFYFRLRKNLAPTGRTPWPGLGTLGITDEEKVSQGRIASLELLRNYSYLFYLLKGA